MPYLIRIFNPPDYSNEPDYDGDEYLVAEFEYETWPALRRGWLYHLNRYEGYYYSVCHNQTGIVSGAYDPGDYEFLDAYRKEMKGNK